MYYWVNPNEVSPRTCSGFGRTVPLDNVQTVMVHVRKGVSVGLGRTLQLLVNQRELQFCLPAA